MAMDFIGLSVGMGYTDETVIGGGALKGKNCVVSNIEEVTDGVKVTFQWTLDNGTVQTETVLFPRGTQGEAGVAGKSAYEIWLEAGNTGTEEDFLISLVGEKGADGTMTFEDLTEEQKASLKGEDGKSAYEIWLEQGNTGTEQDFLDSLKGADGTMTFEDLTDEQKESLKGEDGKSAYEIWLEAGNTGSEEDFLLSLKGDTGADGQDGEQGENGRGIATASVNDSGVLVIEYSDGITEEVGVVKGADGTSVNILGDLTSTDELPDADQQKGDGYLINGDLWVYTASAEPEAVNGFVNVGSIKGPAGNDGFSPTITPNPDNTDDVYKLDITTKDGTFTTPNLRGGDEVTKYTYAGTGNLAGETYYSYEDLSTKIGETVEVTASNRYGESQDTLTIISKISDTELEVDNGAWIATIMLTNTQTIDAKIIDDARTSTTSTWSSTKIKDELDNVFDNLTEEQKESLKGEDGFSPIITENEDNTDDVYKLDIETKDGKFTTPNLKGKDGEGSKSYTHSVKVIGTVGSTYYSTNIDYDKIREVYETGNPITGLYGGWTLDRVESDDASMEAFSKFATCLDKQITATPDYISVYDLFSIQYDLSASVEAGSEYTVTYEWNVSVIDDDTTDSDTTWSSEKIQRELEQSFDNLTPEQIESLRGPQGDKGEDGQAGADGKSAYEIWLEAGNSGSESDFLNSLKGEKGETGPEGPQGEKGETGATGADGFSPVVTVTATNNGHKVSIEDSEGVKEFEVLDGVVAEILHTDLTGFDGITTVLDLVNALLEEYRTERKNVRFESGSISNSTLTDLPQDYGYLTIKAGGTNILEVTFAYSNLGFKKMYYGFLNRTADETSYSSLDWKEVTFKDDLSGYAKTSDIDTVNKTIKESICASGIKSTSRTSFKVVAELKEKLSTLQGTYFKFNYIVNNKLNEVDIIVTSSGAYYKHSKGDEIPKEVSYTLENDTSLSIGIKLTNGATGYKHIECPIGSVTSIVISNTFYTGNTIATSY